MPPAIFTETVYVEDMNLIRPIRTPMQAVEYLNSWPNEAQGLAFDVVLTALNSTVRGEFPCRAVEADFRRLLKRSSLLREGPNN
jgi:hypothetical protein